MDHHPYVAIVMTAGGVVLKREIANELPVTDVPRIAAFQNVVLGTRMERTAGLLLIAALPIENPRIDSFLIESLRIDTLRIDNRLIDGPPLTVALPRAVLQATVFPIVAQEIRARVTAGLPLIVAPQSTGPQIASQIASQIVPLEIGP
jgi:hypothetical protein